MATVLDVARYILDRLGEIEAVKLQKLCYYSQAWHLTWEGEAMFAEDFEAWENGPVVMDLYRSHRLQRLVLPAQIDGCPSNLSEACVRVVDEVLRAHGAKSGSELSALTHREGPWCDARAGLAPNQASRNVITKESMALYFTSLGRRRADWSSESVDDALTRFIANRDQLLARLA
jgi:uncharacterized phage-associated protein